MTRHTRFANAEIVTTSALVPLAAGDDWMKLIIPLVFLVIYVINHLLASAKTKPAAPPPARPARKPPMGERTPRPPQQVPAEPSTQQAELNAEIEQFLKRAEARRGEGQRRGQAAKAVKAPAKPAAKQPPQPPTPRREPRTRRGFGDVAESVEKHLGHRGFESRTEHLADDIVRADQQMEDHLQKAFSRKVGTLDDSGDASKAPLTDAQTAAVLADGPSAETGIAIVLANPQTLKQAVVLTEIFARPEHRW
jgi:hypothetical protein